ncbi:phosphonate C-P lyase system protein PhnH [Roseomonas sp. GC11]|uniref:phosphonate C-P lyase system protein PhnH n=1 Tax=Roseomonas sp. GC11 TaxID=2950546 RepID=UPI00210A1DFF|nr:phosphonate C-P lyase system protein PhnH [Roseomonas sp. GC11]MCQ4160233.1 phosphonate C-P lyase system protein PhnH [Roseomonas sp. GC11]
MIRPGFTDPVKESQSCFRAVLEAMSRPGRIQEAGTQEAGGGLTPPEGLHPATAAVLLTLADAETPLWQDAGAGVAEWLRFHAGCPLVAAPEEAAFLLATGAPPALETLELGSEEEPQAGATLILQVAALEAAPGLILEGPGIAQRHELRVSGLPAGFWAARARLRPLFPRGLDLILCAGTRLAALPRTTRVTEG